MSGLTNISFCDEGYSFSNAYLPKKHVYLLSPLGDRSPLGMFTFPFLQRHYTIGGGPLVHADSEKDLDILMNPGFSFNDRHESILSKANQQRNCNFVEDTRRKSTWYPTLVRSQFEHCSQVWRPTGKTCLEKFDNFRKE